MFTKIFSTLFLVSFLTVSTSFAQFGLNNLIKTDANAPVNPALTQLSAAKDLLAKNYVNSTQNITGALGQILSSVGGGNDILSKLSAAKNLQPASVSANSTSALRQSIDAAAAMLKQKLQGNQSLTPDAAKNFQNGFGSFVSGLSSLKGLMPQANSLTQQAQNILSNSSLQDKMKVGGIMSQLAPLAQSVPMDFNSYKGILTLLMQYATSHNIQIPAAATTLLQ